MSGRATSPRLVKILHIDDDPQLLASAAETLGRHDVVVDGAANGAAALALAANGGYDVIVLDRMLPDMSGIEILARLRDAGNATPVLMLSALGRSENRVEGLDAGADDYLAKPFEPQELLARVRALARRSQHGGLSPVIVHGSLECHVKARTACRNGRHVPLSPREFDLFHYLMRNAGEIVTREMLLANVWHLNFDPQTNVVDVGVGRLRRKLEDAGDGPVLSTIWGTGYRLQDA